jgi:hypothetical protein
MSLTVKRFRPRTWARLGPHSLPGGGFAGRSFPENGWAAFRGRSMLRAYHAVALLAHVKGLPSLLGETLSRFDVLPSPKGP